jgi:hypothetical protein
MGIVLVERGIPIMFKSIFSMKIVMQSEIVEGLSRLFAKVCKFDLKIKDLTSCALETASLGI